MRTPRTAHSRPDSARTHATAACAAAVALCLLARLGATAAGEAVSEERHRGVCYAAWRSPDAWLSAPSDETLRRLADLGVNWVSLRVTWFQDRFDTPALHPGEATPIDEAIAHAVCTSHDLGMKTMLVLVVDLADDSGSEWSPGSKWRGMIGFPDERRWQEWFAAYAGLCARYASLAEACGADMLCIGTELTLAATTHEQAWREIIAGCRERYAGLLTYQANWSPLSYCIDDGPALARSGNWQGEYRQVRFWDALDYACLCIYFPLSREARPSLGELEVAWEPWRDELRAWAATVGKPVLFGEVGYHSALGAAWEPWTHYAAAEASPYLQADCYEVFLRTFWNEPWVAGVYWWLAAPPDEPDLDNGGTGFLFLGKPAEEVLRRWYRR